MLEWLICAASVATQAPSDAGLASQESNQADFFEFLADWDEDDAAPLDTDADGGEEGAIVGNERGKDGARVEPSPMPAPGREEEIR